MLTDVKHKATWDAQQQMDSVRKLYQRAVCIPLDNVEALWKAYDAFESGLNKGIVTHVSITSIDVLRE